jgi:arylsulfatase A-like enzyme
MQWKGVIPAGQTYEKPVSSLDILATIASQTDVKINPDKPLDGVNLVPYLTGEKKGEPHDYLFWRKWEQNGMAIRHRKTKVVADRNQEENPPELYDLHSNVREAGELKSTSGTSYDHLLSKWQAWDEQMKDREFPTLGADEWWE